MADKPGVTKVKVYIQDLEKGAKELKEAYKGIKDVDGVKRGDALIKRVAEEREYITRRSGGSQQGG